MRACQEMDKATMLAAAQERFAAVLQMLQALPQPWSLELASGLVLGTDPPGDSVALSHTYRLRLRGLVIRAAREVQHHPGAQRPACPPSDGQQQGQQHALVGPVWTSRVRL